MKYAARVPLLESWMNVEFIPKPSFMDFYLVRCTIGDETVQMSLGFFLSAFGMEAQDAYEGALKELQDDPAAALPIDVVPSGSTVNCVVDGEPVIIIVDDSTIAYDRGRFFMNSTMYDRFKEKVNVVK